MLLSAIATLQPATNACLVRTARRRLFARTNGKSLGPKCSKARQKGITLGVSSSGNHRFLKDFIAPHRNSANRGSLKGFMATLNNSAAHKLRQDFAAAPSNSAGLRFSRARQRHIAGAASRPAQRRKLLLDRRLMLVAAAEDGTNRLLITEPD
jgi:hypothetical protein